MFNYVPVTCPVSSSVHHNSGMKLGSQPLNTTHVFETKLGCHALLFITLILRVNNLWGSCNEPQNALYFCNTYIGSKQPVLLTKQTFLLLKSGTPKSLEFDLPLGYLEHQMS